MCVLFFEYGLQLSNGFIEQIQLAFGHRGLFQSGTHTKKRGSIFKLNYAEHRAHNEEDANVEIYSLSKRTSHTIDELMKMPTDEFYTLYLTDKRYNQLIENARK